VCPRRLAPSSKTENKLVPIPSSFLPPKAPRFLRSISAVVGPSKHSPASRTLGAMPDDVAAGWRHSCLQGGTKFSSLAANDRYTVAHHAASSIQSNGPEAVAALREDGVAGTSAAVDAGAGAHVSDDAATGDVPFCLVPHACSSS
jgi:hypothetical protein